MCHEKFCSRSQQSERTNRGTQRQQRVRVREDDAGGRGSGEEQSKVRQRSSQDRALQAEADLMELPLQVPHREELNVTQAAKRLTIRFNLTAFKRSITLNVSIVQ